MDGDKPHAVFSTLPFGNSLGRCPVWLPLPELISREQREPVLHHAVCLSMGFKNPLAPYVRPISNISLQCTAAARSLPSLEQWHCAANSWQAPCKHSQLLHEAGRVKDPTSPYISHHLPGACYQQAATFWDSPQTPRSLSELTLTAPLCSSER